MRELKPIADAGEPGTIILVAADAGTGDEERFVLPVTDNLLDMLTSASGLSDGPAKTGGAAESEAAGTDDGANAAVDATAVAEADAAADEETDEAAAKDAAADDPATDAGAAGSPARPEPKVVEPSEPRLVLRPREIQDRVRGGASVEELIELTGMPARRIEPFAHPVLAERARIAELGKHSRPRRADGPAQLSLWEILATAFAARGLDLSTSEWDAWRDPAGQWIIGVTWSVGHSTTTAEWAFHAEGASASTVARNTIAAELVDPDFARPRRNLSAVDDGAPGLRPAPAFDEAPAAGDADAADPGIDDAHDDDFLRHPDEDPAPKRRRKTVMPSWEDVLLGVRPTDRK
ncbi:DUF3071 domain-containing protein [Corynebacterium xerosis]|uniref:DUF3071 domain-containing protein n=1 Tax=Corynebacterium xerosis TaxID=1725 RepID=A0A6B8TSH0_9CORY|nr:septation protein SepH [Corynebacterium xerosis]QGS34113.1 DUF3071 domain-containing protein [Corynebacterium xerosis]